MHKENKSQHEFQPVNIEYYNYEVSREESVTIDCVSAFV